VSNDKNKTNLLNNISEDELNQLVQSLSNASERALDNSREVMEKSVQIARDYPIHTAIGAGVIGFFAGLIANKLIK